MLGLSKETYLHSIKEIEFKSSEDMDAIIIIYLIFLDHAYVSLCGWHCLYLRVSPSIIETAESHTGTGGASWR